MAYVANAAGILVPNNATAITPLSTIFQTVADSIADPGAGGKVDWAPTITLTNITLGNGELNASFRTFLGVIVWRFVILLGSTSSIDGAVAVSTPAAPDFGTWNVLGTGYADDASSTASRATVTARVASAASMNFFIDGGSINATAPFTWAVGDRLAMGGAYMVAA